MSLLNHFSHEHPLILKDKLEFEVDNETEMDCYGCREPIMGDSSATAYSCMSCNNFHLHLTCAKLPTKINQPLHKKHSINLVGRPFHYLQSPCYVCERQQDCFTYSCLYGCEFNMCSTCTSNQKRVFHHPAHEHSLTLMQREVLLHCDACDTEAKDRSYACTSCDFWMHKSCAASPATVELKFHDHPLLLAYFIPFIYRTFSQFCEICDEEVVEYSWLYYCDRCRYFVHLKCATSVDKLSLLEKKIAEAANINYQERDLVQLPLSSKEAFMELMIDQFGKLAILNVEVENKKHGSKKKTTKNKKKYTITALKPDPLPQVIIHSGHKEHPLVLLEEFQNCRNKEDDELLTCNGCTLPVSVAHPFYACIPCHFFIHKFCAQLVMELPAGACPCHPEHALRLCKYDIFHKHVKCDLCRKDTNGLFYVCETCDIAIDILCCFLPNKLKHRAHMHPLVLEYVDFSGEMKFCSSCNTTGHEMIFKCKTCNKFQIDLGCALYPGNIRHRWDPHPIPLICGKLAYEGLMYCEICEEEVNPKGWLYHCGECDHSFHTDCLHPSHNVKFGGKLLVDIHPHRLTHVYKTHTAGWSFICGSCGYDFFHTPGCFICFECVGCDFRLCELCATKLSMSGG